MSCQVSKLKDPQTGRLMVVAPNGLVRPRCADCGEGGGCCGLGDSQNNVTLRHLEPGLRQAAQEFYDGWLASHGIKRQNNGTLALNMRRKQAERMYEQTMLQTGLPPTW